jgi:tyrosyl-tRNA synthetase
VVRDFHTAAAAASAAAEFERVHARRELPGHSPTIVVSFAGGDDKAMTRLMCDAGLATSTSEAARKVQQGAVRLDGARVTDPRARLTPATLPGVLQVGRRVVRLVADTGT